MTKLYRLNLSKSLFIHIMLIISAFMFLIIRAPFGYSLNDEPFIITLGQRLSYGDALFVDEWHLSQLFAPVVLLFYRVFHLFSNTNEGILLSFRYIVFYGGVRAISSTLR